MTIQQLLLIAKVLNHAQEFFGDEDKLISWFNMNSIPLGGRKPIDVLQDNPEEIDTLLHRIEHGIF